ncbi:hypothetical protein ACOSQ2_013835 [Xanthoceras sorbifolium]
MVKLPDDMIIEILSILPVKSLIRFRCISKSWYALVRSSFISKYLKNDHNMHLVVDLYNIATKELRTLPKIEAPFSRYFLNVGFGFDPLSNSYKLVFLEPKLVECTTGTGSNRSHIVEVYTLNSHSWRNVKGCNSNID